MESLVEHLGFDRGARLLIVTADDLGFSYGTNIAIYESLRQGVATSASLMVPAPWARGAAYDYRGEDVGVHLTINAELDVYRWGPITQAPSLLDGDGGFPRTIDDVWEHADLEEVRREWRAQIERAILWGFDVSHLDVHLGGVELKPEFFDVYLDLAEEFALPIRLPDKKEEPRIGFPFRSLAKEHGVLAPERLIAPSVLGSEEDAMYAALVQLDTGVTELSVHPALDSPELRAASSDWESRTQEHALVAAHGALERAIRRSNIACIGFRALRNVMRSS